MSKHVKLFLFNFFIYEINPDIATAYHSSGEIIYWFYFNKYKDRDFQLDQEFAKITGYSPVPTTVNNSGRGYTDWMIQEFHRPGFTPEISPYVGDRHVPPENFPKIWAENKTIGLWMVSKADKLYNQQKKEIF